jgi:hypothetical protein
MASLESMVSKYIVTAAQRGANYHEGFLASLEKYAKEHKSEIIVVPIAGQKPDELLHKDLQKHTIATSYSFSKNLLLEDFPVKPQQIRPLTGLGRFIQGNKSAVVASPKQHLEVLATSNSDLPKILVTTGAVTRPNYDTANRLGAIAEKDHVYGALIVEIDDKTGEFHYRHIRSKGKDGSFIDLGTSYNAFKANSRAFGGTLVLGDLHVGQLNKEAIKASMALIQEVKPQYVVIHDLFDGYSISHHDLGKQVYRAQKQRSGKLSLVNELKQCGEFLTDLIKYLPRDSQVIVVKSNHDEHLNRYLEEGRYGSEPDNLYLSSKLATAMIDGKDPLKEGIKEVYGNFGNRVRFLTRDDDFKVHGVQAGSHGDLGSNGSRGTLTSQQINYGKSVVGHAHTPAMRGDAYRVGTLTNLKLDYNRGPSSWLNTNGIINPDGSVQLINIINGRYKR